MISSNSSSQAPGASMTVLLHLDGASTQVPQIIAAWVIMTVVGSITVCLRFYTRRYILTVLGPEDWLILVAMILSIGACIGFIRQTQSALGHHISTLTPSQLTHWGMEQWYSFLFYTLSLAATKTSILILYTRILVHGIWRIANLAVLGVVTACNVWAVVAMFIQCIPLQAAWDPTVKGAWCLGIVTQLGNSILHVVTDFAIFALPLPVVVGLTIHRRQKVGLMVVFCLGFVVCLFSLIRILVIRSLDFSDVPYQFSTIALLGAVEVNLAIICACLVTLKPLVARLFPRFLDSTAAAGTSSSSHHHSGEAAIRTVSTRGGRVGSSNQRDAKRASVTIVEQQHRFAKLEEEESDTAAAEREMTFELEMKRQVATSTTTHRGSGLYESSYFVPEPSKAYDRLGLTR